LQLYCSRQRSCSLLKSVPQIWSTWEYLGIRRPVIRGLTVQGGTTCSGGPVAVANSFVYQGLWLSGEGHHTRHQHKMTKRPATSRVTCMRQPYHWLTSCLLVGSETVNCGSEVVLLGKASLYKDYKYCQQSSVYIKPSWSAHLSSVTHKSNCGYVFVAYSIKRTQILPAILSLHLTIVECIPFFRYSQEQLWMCVCCIFYKKNANSASNPQSTFNRRRVHTFLPLLTRTTVDVCLLHIL